MVFVFNFVYYNTHATVVFYNKINNKGKYGNVIIHELVTKFEAYLLTEKCVSLNTFSAYKTDLNQFIAYLEKRHTQNVELISEDILKEFLHYLYQKSATARTMSRKISALKLFFNYAHDRFGVANSAQDLIFPKLEKSLPSALSEQEIQQLFTVADQDVGDLGKRTRVMLYLLYVSGMRISELIHIKIPHIHFDTGFIEVVGKRGRGRLIPLPQPMLELLQDYLKTIHRSFVTADHGARATDWLFPTFYAGKVKPITRQSFWMTLKDVWLKTGSVRTISPHILRHSFATHMLKRGADLRSLQILLGHESIATVQIYTHVETSYLRSVYDKKHPRS